MVDKIEFFTSRLIASFNSTAAIGVDAVINLHLSGEGGGDITIMIRNQLCHINRGAADAPRVSIYTSIDNGMKILSGEYDGIKAYYSGKMKVRGDIGFAAKIPSFFK